MKPLKCFTLIMLLLSFVKLCNAQDLPSERSVNWANAGLKSIQTSNFEIIEMQNFSIVNDGKTANDTFLTNALATVSSNGAVLVFPSGEFLFNNTINLPSNVIIKGDGANMTTFLMDLSGANNAISIKGSLINSITTAITQTALKGSNSIEVLNATEFEAGDWIQIFMDDSGLITSDWAKGSVGQIVEISSVNSNQIILSSALRMDFDKSNSLYIKKIEPIKNVGIECLKIKRLDDTAPSQTSSVYFEYAVNSWVKGIESSNTTFSHIEAKSSSNLSISNSYFHHAFDYGGNGRAYGVVLHFTTNESLVENNIFEHLRHSMLVQAGANGNAFMYNYSLDPFWTSSPSNAAGDVVLHGNYPFANLFEQNIIQNIVIDNSHGPNGPINTFLRNRAENYGIFFSASNSPKQNFIGNEITNTSFLQSLVNYTILGVDHFIYGNNNKGVINPVGTTEIYDKSYYYTTKPDFISIQEWASIGAPNELNSGEISAQKRYDSRMIFDSGSCNSSVLKVDEFDEGSIKVFPNPILLKVSIQSRLKVNKVKITNQLGKLVYSKKIDANDTVLNLSQLNSGLYFLKIMFTNGQESVKKIIKY